MAKKSQGQEKSTNVAKKRPPVAEAKEVAGLKLVDGTEQPEAKHFGLWHRKEKHPAHTMPFVFRVIFSGLLIAGMAILFTWFILWRQNLEDANATWDFVNENPELFQYSCLIIGLLMMVVAAATWRPFLTIGLSFAAFSIITFIHIQKYNYRAAPLLPEDFLMASNAGNLLDFVDIWEVIWLAVGSVLVIVGTALLEHRVRLWIGKDNTGLALWERWAVVPRAVFTMVALTALVLVASPVVFHKQSSETTTMADWPKTSFVIWNQTENYEKNGFIIAFLYNLGGVQITEPDDYSEDAIAKIAERYRVLKKADAKRKPLAEVVDNIIVVLDETFYDPELLGEYYAHDGGDTLPNLHRIFQKYPSGYMYSPEYGGGTANVEFEVFTGLSNYWAMSTIYANWALKLHHLESIAGWSKSNGFETTAVHAYDGTMYKRNIVYPMMGFSNFIDVERMRYTEKENLSPYVNDRSVYREILDVLGGGGDQMVGAVTMQNHSPYWLASYTNRSFAMRSQEHPEWWELEIHFQSLHNADKYLGEFLDALDKSEERTVVLWFGDHAAGILNEYAQSDNADEVTISHLTPYFVYANFDIESPYTAEEAEEINLASGLDFRKLFRQNEDLIKQYGLQELMQGIDLPTTSSNCLWNTMANALKVEKPALLYLVDEVCAEVPVLARAHQSGTDEPERTEALRAYELINYDILLGKQYWYKK